MRSNLYHAILLILPIFLIILAVFALIVAQGYEDNGMKALAIGSRAFAAGMPGAAGVIFVVWLEVAAVKRELAKLEARMLGVGSETPST